jgi:hypothetical protein
VIRIHFLLSCGYNYWQKADKEKALRYLVVIEKGLNSRGIEIFSAFYPDVPRCNKTSKARK